MAFNKPLNTAATIALNKIDILLDGFFLSLRNIAVSLVTIGAYVIAVGVDQNSTSFSVGVGASLTVMLFCLLMIKSIIAFYNAAKNLDSFGKKGWRVNIIVLIGWAIQFILAAIILSLPILIFVPGLIAMNNRFVLAHKLIMHLQ